MQLTNRIVVSTLAYGVTTIAGFIGTLYLARVLGPAPIGAFALGMTIIKWAEITDLGFGNATRKRISEYEEENRYFSASLLIRGTTTTIIIVVLVFFREYINRYLGGEYGWFVVAMFAVTSGYTFVSWVITGTHLVHIKKVLDAIEMTLRSGMQIALAVFGFGTAALFYGYIFSSTIGVIVGVLVVAYVGLRIKSPSSRHFHGLFSYAKYSWLGRIRGKSFSWIDIFILGFFVSQDQIGIYQVSWTLVMTLWIFSRSISSNLFPEISYLSKEAQMNRVQSLFREGLVYSGILAIPGLVGVWVIGDHILGIYGSAFVQAHDTLKVLGLLAVLVSYEGLLVNILDALDRPDLTFRVNFLFILVNVGGNILLIPMYGILGAAVATTVAILGSLIYAGYLVTSVVSVDVPTTEVGKQLVSAATMGAVLFSFSNVFPLQNIPHVFTAVASAAVLYFTVLLIISQKVRGKATTILQTVSVQLGQ